MNDTLQLLVREWYIIHARLIEQAERWWSYSHGMCPYCNEYEYDPYQRSFMCVICPACNGDGTNNSDRDPGDEHA